MHGARRGDLEAEAAEDALVDVLVDDLHVDVHDTAQVRDLFKRVEKTLLHEGDMFAILSSGQSSLHIDLTYDRKQFEDAINRIAGNGLSPSEIIQTQVL